MAIHPKRYVVKKTYFKGDPKYGRTTTLLFDNKPVLVVMGVVPKRSLIAQYAARVEAGTWHPPFGGRKNPGQAQVATVVARGNKKLFVVATDSSESNDALLTRVNAIRVVKRVNTNPQPLNEWDIEDIADEGARLGTQQARALGHTRRAEREYERAQPKFFNVTWYSASKGKRTGFIRPIEAVNATDAKRQAKAMITNDKPVNIIAKEAKHNPKSTAKLSATRIKLLKKAAALQAKADRMQTAGHNSNDVAHLWDEADQIRRRVHGSGSYSEGPVGILPNSTVSEKIAELAHEGYPQRQAIAIAFSEKRAGKVNPLSDAIEKRVAGYKERVILSSLGRLAGGESVESIAASMARSGYPHRGVYTKAQLKRIIQEVYDANYKQNPRVISREVFRVRKMRKYSPQGYEWGVFSKNSSIAVGGGYTKEQAQKIAADMNATVKAGIRKRNPGNPRIVHNHLLGGWYVVVGPHQTPLNGRFESKAAAQAWLGRKNNPKRVEKHFLVEVSLKSNDGQFHMARKPIIAINGVEARQEAVESLLIGGGEKRTRSSGVSAAGIEYKIGKAEQVTKDAYQKARERWGYRRSNPGTREMSERFNGGASGAVQELKASDRAPSDLSRAGKLVFLKVAGKRAALRIPGAVVCIAPKTERLWIAGNRTPLLNHKAKPGELLEFGEIDQICYETAKRHIGNGRKSEYIHTFGEDGGRKPRLQVDAEGMPIIAGGDYKIRAEGIVD